MVIKNEDKVLDDNSDVFEKIEQLGALKESGLITEKEFLKAVHYKNKERQLLLYEYPYQINEMLWFG